MTKDEFDAAENQWKRKTDFMTDDLKNRFIGCCGSLSNSLADMGDVMEDMQAAMKSQYGDNMDEEQQFIFDAIAQISKYCKTAKHEIAYAPGTGNEQTWQVIADHITWEEWGWGDENN